ncbi:hypothetical protein LSAT2_011923 [Lamellibrachia satsuma]|nr:hypothetical protein LSAT2_011923 [Lamellibrachia satsuma]
MYTIVCCLVHHRCSPVFTQLPSIAYSNANESIAMSTMFASTTEVRHDSTTEVQLPYSQRGQQASRYGQTLANAWVSSNFQTD